MHFIKGGKKKIPLTHIYIIVGTKSGLHVLFFLLLKWQLSTGPPAQRSTGMGPSLPSRYLPLSLDPNHRGSVHASHNNLTVHSLTRVSAMSLSTVRAQELIATWPPHILAPPASGESFGQDPTVVYHATYNCLWPFAILREPIPLHLK